MKVSTLIEFLAALPQGATVGLMYDGADRGTLTNVYRAQSGRVILTADSIVYNTEDRPQGAPTRENDPFWKLPKIRDY